jgi:hypothetical protein
MIAVDVWSFSFHCKISESDSMTLPLALAPVQGNMSAIKQQDSDCLSARIHVVGGDFEYARKRGSSWEIG